jgi:hypothetical protein
MRFLATLALSVAALVPAYSQINCQMITNSVLVRAGGEAERLSDVFFDCTSPSPISTLLNIEIFLNVNATSHITNASTLESDALLLIDEPKPGVPNVSNGFPYMGQVHGKLGVLAGAAGSGNVYQGTVVGNRVEWVGVPYVGPGQRLLRFTNLRGDAELLQATAHINATVSVGAPVQVIVSPQTADVAIILDGLTFTSGSPSTGILDLTFLEQFAGAFRKRIENTTAGPLTSAHQDIPASFVGGFYCTESIFTPEFSALTPGALGSADTGTRLLAKISKLPPGVHMLVVPNEVTSANGALVAHRVHPPFGAAFEGGTVSTAGGNSHVTVQNHAAELLYEVTAAAPFKGIDGCNMIDSFKIQTTTVNSLPLGSVVAAGHLAPIDPTPTASHTAPAPRFAQ